MALEKIYSANVNKRNAFTITNQAQTHIENLANIYSDLKLFR